MWQKFIQPIDMNIYARGVFDECKMAYVKFSWFFFCSLSENPAEVDLVGVATIIHVGGRVPNGNRPLET